MSCEVTISILITYYNEGELITECLESLVQNQTFPLEILIYDDASSNPAEKYIPNYLKSTVKIFRSESNKGPGYGRTKLLEMASGQYVHFHDSDDLFAPDWVSKVQTAINFSKADVILTGIKSINENGDTLSDDVMGIKDFDEVVNIVKIGLSGSVLVPSTTFLRQLGLSIGGYESREVLPQSEDFHFHLKLGLLNPQIKIIKEALIVQRIRANSHSHQAGLLVCYQSAVKALNLLKPELSQNYPKELAQAYVRIGHQLLVLGDKQTARLVFQSAKKLYPVSFTHRSAAFALTAKLLGVEFAEHLSLFFQKIKQLRPF